MVKPFQFARLPLILFGCGKRSELPGLIRGFGTKALLVTRGRSFIDSADGKTLLKTLLDKKILYHTVVINSEPSPRMVDEAVSAAAEFVPDVVTAIGGGSVLDAGKAISAMLRAEGSVIEYLEGVGTWDHPGGKVPFIALPTTSGTGSEATKNAVISSIGKEGFKRSLRHDNFVPDIALVDPELTVSCPPEITAASGMDCFTQLVEAYLSVKSNEYTDALAIEGLKAIKRSLRAVNRDGNDIAARTDMSFAALTSGICLANTGLGAVHGFASSIGGMYKIPHGVICGTLMAGANELNVKKIRKGYGNPEALKKYTTLGQLFLDEKGRNEDYYIDGFIHYLRLLTDELHLPGLKKYGIKEGDLQKICSQTEIKNNPAKLETSDLMEILLERFI
ncbi:MAG: iron-containing alcohol dehydrogenase [Bacteroidota bacterium]